jgi:peroxiredoxin
MRKATIAFLVCAIQAASGSSQVLSGQLAPRLGAPGQYLVLHRISGQERIPLDSVRISRKGRFRFKPTTYPLGYYRLGVGDDQIDIILNPTEPRVSLRFSERPLQSGINVVESLENQRLWEYKLASRDTQDKIRIIAGQRNAVDSRDIESLLRLAHEEEVVNSKLQATLQRLVAQDSASYFAKVVGADQRLMDALDEGPQAIRDAMDWRDASLTRCTVYSKAIMAILQAATPAAPYTLAAASDSILAWASLDTACWSFARWQLVDLFATYGPEEVVQHLVDLYVSGPMTIAVPDARLLSLVAAQLKMAIGSTAPNVELPSPIHGHTDGLSALLQPYPCTALFFYSSTCDHCHEQMPLLNELFTRFNSKGLNIIGIAIDDDEAAFRANIAERGLLFPCYSELRGWGSPAAKAFAVRATPWFVVLNREGRIQAKPHDARELQDLLPGLLP